MSRTPVEFKKNKKIGLWRVLKPVKPVTLPSGGVKTRWLCLCTGCGTKHKVTTTSLRAKSSLGCRDCRRYSKGKRNREMVRLRDKVGLSYADIGARFGVSLWVARKVIMREKNRD